MPWTTPSLRDVRTMGRDFVTAALAGAAMIGNNVLRVITDQQSGLAHLNLLYLDWLSKQLLVDTSETEWLDRHGQIWLTTADGSRGRKAASFATGSVTLTGTTDIIVAAGTVLQASVTQVQYETTEEVVIGAGATSVAIRALDAGAAGNAVNGDSLALVTAVSGVDSQATVVELSGGADVETDDELRARVLERIQQPPMGGDAEDYVAWADKVAGVTRAWSSPLEMGVGTVTLRFMADDLRATGDPVSDGFPSTDDIASVQAYLDTVRPVAVKDFFVQAPIPEPIDFTVADLDGDSASIRQGIIDSVKKMLKARAAPAFAINGVGQGAQTIYAAWVSEAISETAGVKSFDLTMTDHVMPSNGHLAVLGSVTFI